MITKLRPGIARILNSLAITAALFTAACEDPDSRKSAEIESPLYSAKRFTAPGHVFDVFHPDGYKLELLNRHLKGPRILHFHGDRLFVGSKSGNVYWLDPPYDRANILVALDDYPHSVVVRDDWIYIAQPYGVFRARYSVDSPEIDAEDLQRYVKLPGTGGHASRTLKISPDNELYVSIGINGNCPDQYLDLSYPEGDRRGGIYRIDESGSRPLLVPYATGLRNPVGFDWAPDSGILYASNNGPDHLGFEHPPEYFSRLTEGSFHGMPWFQYDGESLVRDDCVKSEPPRPAEDVELPVALLPARNAPLDLVFVNEKANASELSGDAIIALHGSWGTANGGKMTGDKATRRHPKLVVVDFENGAVTGVRDLLTGFQQANGKRYLRPAGIAIGADGDIYFSSDDALSGLYRLKKL